MIRINLLKAFASGGSEGYAASVTASDRDQVILAGFKRILVIVLGPGALLVYELRALPVLQAKLAATQAELSETTTFNNSKSGIAAEIKKYEEEQTKINAQMNFVNKIARDKINEFKLFQHLQNSTPESVWVNRLEFKNNFLTINIESDVPEELNKFAVRLSNSDFLTSVKPTNQDIRVDPFGLGINTNVQNLEAVFTSDAGTP